eukprot:15481514-Alexandrium_andersonii.AAC.1
MRAGRLQGRTRGVPAMGSANKPRAEDRYAKHRKRSGNPSQALPRQARRHLQRMREPVRPTGSHRKRP